MEKLQNIVFDLGGVLLNWQPKSYLVSLFDDPELRKKMQEIVFASVEWQMLDRGVISQAEGVERLKNQHPSFKAEIDLVFASWFEILTPIESTARKLPQLKKQGYKLYVISNFHELAFSYVYEKNAWFKLFDGLILSYEVKALKPEPAIYQALLNQFNLQSAASLFIDDLASNIEGARRVGMRGIQYQTAEQFEHDLNLALTGVKEQ